MADTKITALTALTAADPANDVIPIVDISDTSMAASGTTKKISINNILACSPSATLASATITGDLTVDTNVLKVDTTLNRVGIGTASPNVRMELSVADAAEGARLTASSAWLRLFPYLDATDKTKIQAVNGTNSALSDLTIEGLNLRFNTNAGLSYAISNASVHTWQNVGGVAGTAMTLNSIGLGVGGAPTGIGPIFLLEGIAGRYARFDSKVGAKTWSTGYRSGTLQYEIQEDGTERFVIANGGNVGIGVTPSAWGSASYSVAALQNPAGAFWNYQTSIVSMIQNAFYNNSAQYIYKNNGFASEYYQSSGQHIWRTVASGTAGNVITFTQAMTLDASGRLLVGTTVLNASWDTRLTLSSDSGTTRWAVGPYAAPQNFVISSGAATGVYLNGTAATSWTSASDERLKDIIEPISNAVSKVASLRAVIGKFKFDENNTRKPFLIAQDIQAVLPEAVDASNPDQLGVSYTDVIPLLVAAIKELTARVQTLEAK